MDIARAVEEYSERNPEALASLREEATGPVLRVSGSLELRQSYDLQKLMSLIVESLVPGLRLAVDLSGVTYISSTGVGALIDSLISARKRNVGIVFRRVPPKVSSVLELLGLESFFPFEESDA